MKRWRADTLSKRLFILMWITLVGSHIIAFAVVNYLYLTPTNFFTELPGGRWPTFPSLPPTPGIPQRPDNASAPAPTPRPEFDEPGRPPPDMAARGAAGPDGLSADALALDYGIRLLVIALSAWFGSRWVSGPMRRLARASQSLSGSLGQHAAIPVLDEKVGTSEVREAARVFNDMARRLREQFQARGLMVAAISHDLRTPLTRLRMRMEGMDSDPVAQQRCIEDLREMNTLIDTVLEVFRGDGPGASEALQSTDVYALVQSLTDDLIEQGQPVEFDGAPALAQTQPAALRRVLNNLVGNAVRYGTQAHISVASTASGVRIRVEDKGPGIPPAYLEAVFQPFFRVDGSRSAHQGGTGLGLYIARDLLQRQGAKLTLTNLPAGGLRAEVMLKADQAKPGARRKGVKT